MNIACFLLEDTKRHRRWLRRYRSRDRGEPCPATENHGYHNAMVLLDEAADAEALGDWDRSDARWPQSCPCGYQFEPGDEWQLFTRGLWAGPTGLTTLEDAPVGAMFYADWLNDWRTGPDGRNLQVIVPSHHIWNIDGQASNCDSPCANCGVPYKDHQSLPNCKSYKDSRPNHRCWVRHGVPPVVTVDKCGETCNAGGGSILTPQYHGRLIAGQLTDC